MPRTPERRAGANDLAGFIDAPTPVATPLQFSATVLLRPRFTKPSEAYYMRAMTEKSALVAQPGRAKVS